MDAALAARLAKVSRVQTLVLTHRGRKSGKPYDVIIWFVVDGDKMFLASANKTRQWVKNVRKDPQVSMKIGAETIAGKLRELAPAERERPTTLTQSKYWYAIPFIAGFRLLASLGVVTDNSTAFEVEDIRPA